MKTVLVMTAAAGDDPCVDSVGAELAARGGRLLRFDTDRFPTDTRAALTIGGTRHDDALRLEHGSGALDLDHLCAVWMRQMDPGADLPDSMDPVYREAARVQTDHAVWSLLECIEVFQLDPPGPLARAPHKPRQLQLARAAGLAVPRSLLTNDPERVRAFAAECETGIIAKLIDPSSLGVATAHGERPVYTTALSTEDLDDLDALQYGPMLFQERVPKARELRVTAVGAQLFTAAIGQGSAGADVVDWRSDADLVRNIVACELDPATRRGVLELLDRLELNFATVDLIIRPDDVPVFIEVNTTSYFDFVESATGLPISAAIADLLLGRTAPRVVGA